MDPHDVEFIETPTAAAVLNATETLPHDGWRSRKAISGCIAGLLVLILATVMTIWSGKYSDAKWFEADYWVKAVWVSMAMWGFAFGLVTVDKILELIRVVMPIIGMKRAGK